MNIYHNTNNNETYLNQIQILNSIYQNNTHTYTRYDKKNINSISTSDHKQDTFMRAIPFRKIVSSYIQQIEREYILTHHISYDIMELCFLFYYSPFIKLPNPENATPFRILFAIFNNQIVFLDELWYSFDIMKQLEYLQDNKLNTEFKRRETSEYIMISLSKQLRIGNNFEIEFINVMSSYYEECQFIELSKPILEWSNHDCILSWMNYWITHYNENAQPYTHEKNLIKQKQISKFTEYYRLYIDQCEYNCSHWIIECNLFRAFGFGLGLIKTVCKKMNLKTGPYTRVKKLLSAWGNHLSEKLTENEVVEFFEKWKQQSFGDKKFYEDTFDDMFTGSVNENQWNNVLKTLVNIKNYGLFSIALAASKDKQYVTKQGWVTMCSHSFVTEDGKFARQTQSYL